MPRSDVHMQPSSPQPAAIYPFPGTVPAGPSRPLGRLQVLQASLSTERRLRSRPNLLCCSPKVTQASAAPRSTKHLASPDRTRPARSGCRACLPLAPRARSRHRLPGPREVWLVATRELRQFGNRTRSLPRNRKGVRLHPVPLISSPSQRTQFPIPPFFRFLKQPLPPLRVGHQAFVDEVRLTAAQPPAAHLLPDAELRRRVQPVQP